MTTTFSFIIVNYKSHHVLGKWFASLQHTKLLPHEYEIIVVNNDASEQNALEKLKHIHTFTLLVSPQNNGFGKACNIGAQKARGKILAFINPDTLFIKGDLRDVYNEFKQDTHIGVIGLQLITEENNIQPWSAGSLITLLDILKNNLGFPSSKRLWESKTAIDVDWVSGASLFISRELFNQSKGFDETFFLYFEDADVCRRIQLLGKRILYYPRITVKHLCGQSSTSKKLQKKQYYISQEYYFKKHRPKWESFFLKALRIFHR